MEMITELFKQDIPSIITGCFIILSAVIAIYTIIGKFSKIIGRPVKWVLEKEKDHNLLMNAVDRIDSLWKEHEESVKQSIRHDDAIRQDSTNLTDLFVEKQINDYRWEIINFSNRVSNDESSCNKDGYRHCFATYEKYEKLLEENDMENGEVEISMDIINQSYKDKLKNGF